MRTLMKPNVLFPLLQYRFFFPLPFAIVFSYYERYLAVLGKTSNRKEFLACLRAGLLLVYIMSTNYL